MEGHDYSLPIRFYWIKFSANHLKIKQEDTAMLLNRPVLFFRFIIFQKMKLNVWSLLGLCWFLMLVVDKGVE